VPKHLLRWIVLLIALAGLAAVVWRLTRPDPVQVTVKPVTRGPVEATVANTRAGTVKACRRAKLSPGVGGQIVKLPVHEGDTVKAGQLLLELWNGDLSAQSTLAEREVVSARARAKAACLKAEVAERRAARLLKLRRSDAVSEEQADNSAAEAQALRAQCEAAETEKMVRQAQLSVVRANLSRTRLTAPFDGVVAEINGELFEYVTPSPVGIPTPPAVDVIDNTCFYVSAPIDEVDAAGIRVGMPARVSLDAFRDRKFTGTVRRIADYVLDVEKQARTVDVEVAFSRPEDLDFLLAGYSADIEVILQVSDDVVRVPTEAVMDGRRVFVFEPEQGLVAEKQIRTGISNWDLTEVLEGLESGQQVVVNVDNPDLADGAAALLGEEAP
jgi:HlyD family secretion protein